jgi:threonine dehydrogenase-like Zn-dependent dehydrogenase
MQACEVQRRMRVWRPRVAFVKGAGQIGLLATLILRLKGLDVYTLARRRAPRLPADIVTAYGATYVSTQDMSMHELVKHVGRPDLIVEATGDSQIAFESMQILGHNGVLVWHSVTGGSRHVEVPSDRLNLEFVLGNKLLLGSVNANREHFEMGIRDLALGEMMFPGVTEKILTNKVDGLDNYPEMMRLLVEDADALKVYVEVAKEPGASPSARQSAG